MNSDREIILAAARSLRSTAGREPQPEEIVRLLVRNQVPLLSLVEGQHASEAETSEHVRGVLQSEFFDRALEDERARYDEVHSNFSVAEQLWESHGVQSICFKSAGIAPSFPYTSENFDILFRPQDEPAVKSVLDGLGYVLLSNCDEPQKWLYRLFEAGRSLCAIHVHTRVGWGQGFMLEDELWRRSRRSADDAVTRVPGAEDVLLINTAHAFFENKEFGLHDLMKVRRAISDGVDWQHVDFVAAERGWLPALHFSLAMMGELEGRLFDEPVIPLHRFENTVRASKNMRAQIARARSRPPEMPFSTSWKLVKTLFLAKIGRDKHEPLSFKPALLVLTMARAVRSQTGVRPQNSALFTFSGTDGSGKTAQAESLRDAIALSELRGEIMWARLGATPAMRSLSRLWSNQASGRLRDAGPAVHTLTGRTSGEATRGASQGGRETLHRDIEGFLATGTVPSSAPRTDSLRGVIWASLAGADFTLWLLQIRWKLLRGEIVIADRYLCDLDVELAEKLPSKEIFRAGLVRGLSLIAPRPLRAFLLDVDAETAARRAQPDSGNLDAEEAVRLYREKAQQYDLLPLDASQSFEAISSIVQRESLRAYLNRLFTIGDLFYFKNPFQQNRQVRKQPELARREVAVPLDLPGAARPFAGKRLPSKPVSQGSDASESS